MANVRPASDRLREQRRRELLGWVVVGIGAAVGTAIFASLVASFGW